MSLNLNDVPLVEPPRLAPALELPWYYSIEYAPGEVTPGQRFASIAPVRRLLERIDVDARWCLDLGTMEGLVPILLQRRGAKMVAWDRTCNLPASAPKQTFLSDRLGVPIFCEFTPHLASFQSSGHGPFDVVVLSGVLYHTIDPFGTLLRARSFLRHGGLMIVETAAIRDTRPAMDFNAGGAGGYPNAADANYWFPTTAGLEAMLACARLDPLAVAWAPSEWNLIRLAVACRATHGVPQAGDWYRGQEEIAGNVAANYAEYLSWERLQSDAPLVPFEGDARGSDLSAMVKLSGAVSPDEVERLTVLRLEDRV